MLKSILRSPPVQTLLSWLLAFYMTLVKRTTRWELIGREKIAPIWEGRKAVIGCVWHARVLMTIAGWPIGKAQDPSILISLSPDGAFVAKAAQILHVGVIRGSTAKGAKSKRGFSAFRDMLKHLAEDGCMAVTPDGPRGPRMRAGEGVARLAKLSAAPIMLFAWSTRRRIVFNSWDRFVLPAPFGKGILVWDGPILIAPDADDAQLEAARLEIETRLNAITRLADEKVGVTPIEPAPERAKAAKSFDAEPLADIDAATAA